MLPHPPAGWHEAVPVVLYAIETADLRVKIGATRARGSRVDRIRASEKRDIVVRAAYLAPASDEAALHRRFNALRGGRWRDSEGSEWYPRDLVASWLDALPAEHRPGIAFEHRGRVGYRAPPADAALVLRDLSRRLSRAITVASAGFYRAAGLLLPCVEAYEVRDREAMAYWRARGDAAIAALRAPQRAEQAHAHDRRDHAPSRLHVGDVRRLAAEGQSEP